MTGTVRRSMPVAYSIRHGYKVELAGAPVQKICESPRVGAAALLGTDLPGLRPHFNVSEGDRVLAGDPLFVDRARPEIVFPAPVSGKVRSITLGARRMLSALVVEPDPEAGPPRPGTVEAKTEEALRETLLARGFWPAFRTRPFDRIPSPGSCPDAIFIRAIDTHPLSPDPSVVLAERAQAFRSGAQALTKLTSGPVHICQKPGADLASGLPGVDSAIFSGPHPAGLSTTHVLALGPTRPGAAVWTISYQDVAAIGEFLETGIFNSERIVALAGPRVSEPRLIRTVIGARLQDLTRDAIPPAPTAARVLSGSVLSGREGAYLGRYNTQITVLDAPSPSRRAVLGRFRKRLRAQDAPLPIIPSEQLENALPPGIPAVPLLRALSVGDAEAVRLLGAHDLVEEDVELISCLCTSHADYGALLRRVLDQLEAVE